MNSSRFDPSLFVNPPNPYRPLRMVHGFDKFDKVLPNGPHFVGETEIDEGLDRFLALGYGGAVVNVGFRDYLESEPQWEVYRRGLRAAPTDAGEMAGRNGVRTPTPLFTSRPWPLAAGRRRRQLVFRP